MFTSDVRSIALTLCLVSASAAADDAPKLGRPLTAEQNAAASISIYPDGQGLPEGRGTATDGQRIFDAQCASCHGAKGIGNTAEELAGSTASLSSPEPDKTIGTYWPFATTLFDMISRSMPMQAPGSLTADETYAVTAYLLSLNGIVTKDFEANRATLPKVVMPNRNGFDWIDAK